MGIGVHHRQAGAAWQSPTGYAASHCRRCEMGWTRIGEGGGVITVCLLDREPVLAAMTSCDRFAPKEPVTMPVTEQAA